MDECICCGVEVASQSTCPNCKGDACVYCQTCARHGHSESCPEVNADVE